MRLYSGTYCMCDCGIPTGERDEQGNYIYTGDIVQLWYGHYIGTDIEEWQPSSGLTAVVSNQYTTYTDGRIVENPKPHKIFTMGIARVGVQGGEWKITLVKSHKYIVPNERYLAYGFNFK